MAWKTVCNVADIEKNTAKVFDVDGIKILIVNYGENFRAFPPICPHMEEPLDESGIVANCVLTCSKHLWAWDMRTLSMLGETEKPLKHYETRQEDGNLLVEVVEELLYDFDSEDDFDDDFFSKS
ncbi:MAG: Rieske 2Fe-2S domain-containing protein [Pyrinomonadaceae bacterium]